MSLSDLASLGSFVSGFAVLVSLVFLYFQLRQISEQVRQAEKNQRAFMNQGFTTRAIEILRFGSQNAATTNRAFSGETDFSTEELTFLANHLRSVVLNFQDIFLQHSQGLADQIMLDYQIALLRHFLSWPALRALWGRVRPTIPAQSAAVVDKLIAESPLAEPIDRLAQYRTTLSEILRPDKSSVISQSQA